MECSMPFGGWPSLSQWIPQTNFTRFIPAPASFYSAAGSTVAAAAIGAIYGLIGRVIYPKAGISPLNYAIWFVIAYQIKQCFDLAESRFNYFLGVGAYLDDLENTSEDKLDLTDRIRYYCWKVIHIKNGCLQVIDGVFCAIFHVRPYQEVTQDNVYEASFLEMCRYRIWSVFKSTLLNRVSFALAHHLSCRLGFSLPAQTSVPLILMIQSIIKDIILVPILYVYARICNHLAEEWGEGDHVSAAYRAVWIRLLLPAL